MIRDVLLLVYGLGWLAVLLVTVWRTGTVPAELWAVLGLGIGGILAAFRADDRVGKRGGPDKAEDTTS
jgi:hypothetical protein